MTGSVAGRQPRIEVAFRLAGRPNLQIEFVVDTGFDGYLALPPAAVTALGLPFLHHLVANFADDRDERVAVHQAAIIWDGAEQEVQVLATGRRPLLGTLLMDGFDLHIRFADQGPVTPQRF
jgi:clan AA aspartic protease